MSSFLDQVTDQLNLRWAWEKVRREATPGDIWFDEIELAGFELELDRNLANIAGAIRRGNYRLAPLKPLPFPKNPDRQGNPRIRQMFQLGVRDQVAWTAVVNVVGPHVDEVMPPWSYGNRLYRSIWVEPGNDGKKRRRIGSYRHASGRLYLPFGQSWPIFRRHVYLATRAMVTGGRQAEMDEKTQEELELQESLAAERQCPFVKAEYWASRRVDSTERQLFWCSIDLEKFYPTIDLGKVQTNIVEQLPAGWRQDASGLLGSMLRFQIHRAEWTDDEMKLMDLRPRQRSFAHIPTGLYVAGFLANVALLKSDQQVCRLLQSRNVAHFRFVDDHVFLAYSFEDLLRWIKDYIELLESSGTGAKVNPEKVQPTGLAEFFVGERRRWGHRRREDALRDAELACRLDPQFPSPLMTKTLAMVSTISRTDFNLLEPVEQQALRDQLEHLLLVELPDEEIPEKTRLSFAATRLTRLVECRLANDEHWVRLRCTVDSLEAQIGRENIEKEQRAQLQKELDQGRQVLAAAKARRATEANRVFELLRKVLRQRPDRVRLWTRAVLMCRITGVRGLQDLRADIEDIAKKGDSGRLAAEYLRANLLALTGDQAVVAARVVRDENAAEWRREAARAFIEEAGQLGWTQIGRGKDRRYLSLSWCQYCFGLYCAKLLLSDRPASDEARIAIPYSRRLSATGEMCATKGAVEHLPVWWIWWAGRKTLGALNSRPAAFLSKLAEDLPPSTELAAFWRFFPMDAPPIVLQALAKEYRSLSHSSELLAGWWFDALRGRPGIAESLQAGRNPPGPRRALQVLGEMNLENAASLYEWCERLQEIADHLLPGAMDPRLGEWTALEIVRQAASLVGVEPTFGAAYLRRARRDVNRFPWVHPANFKLPRQWLTAHEPKWEEWRHSMGDSGTGVAYVKEALRVVDLRYTPLGVGEPLFLSVNPVRGLGLLLYGLLTRSFDLPAIWNGPGHADMLALLPRLLLDQMTCSSWTLGVLQACLLPRVTENLHIKSMAATRGAPDDDSLRDPNAHYS